MKLRQRRFSWAVAAAMFGVLLGGAASAQNYYYDPLDRLITATTTNDQVTSWYYDAAGNRSNLTNQTFAAPQYANILNPGEILFEGQSIISSDGSYLVELQTDGNIVIYQVSNGAALWNSATNSTQAVYLIMQGDGNLVLYGPQNAVLWNTGTSGHSGAGAIIQTDGNFVIYPSGGGAALWNTGT